MKIIIAFILLLVSISHSAIADEMSGTTYSHCTIEYQSMLNDHLLAQEKGMIIVSDGMGRKPYFSSKEAERRYIKSRTTTETGLKNIEYDKVKEGFSFLVDAENIHVNDQYLKVRVEGILAILLSIDKLFSEDDQRNYIESPNLLEKKITSQSLMKIGEIYKFSIKDSNGQKIRKLTDVFSFTDDSQESEFKISMRITDCQQKSSQEI